MTNNVIAGFNTCNGAGVLGNQLQPIIDLGTLSARYSADHLARLMREDSLDFELLINDSEILRDLYQPAPGCGKWAEQSQPTFQHDRVPEPTNRKRKCEGHCNHNSQSAKRIKTDGRASPHQASRSASNSPVFPQYSTPLHDTRCEAIAMRASEHEQVVDGARSCALEVDVPIDVMLKIKELDTKILKLQGERAALLERSSAGLAIVDEKSDGTAKGTSKVTVSIVSVGIQALDEPQFDETSSLLHRVGCLHSELNGAITSFKRTCFINDGCSSVEADIGKCLAFISNHISANQQIQVRNNSTIHLDPPTTAPQVQIAIGAANGTLRAAQCVTLFSTYITKRLDVSLEAADKKVRDCDQVCQEQGIAEQHQVKSVLRGNRAAIIHATKTWAKTSEDATTTIRALIGGMHLA